jgi:hypothetical protein
MNRRSLLKKVAGVAAMAAVPTVAQAHYPVLRGLEGSISIKVQQMNGWLASIKTVCDDGRKASRIVNLGDLANPDRLINAVRHVIELESDRVGHRFKNIQVSIDIA